jgi:hypothetical protein
MERFCARKEHCHAASQEKNAERQHDETNIDATAFECLHSCDNFGVFDRQGITVGIEQDDATKCGHRPQRHNECVYSQELHDRAI